MSQASSDTAPRIEPSFADVGDVVTRLRGTGYLADEATATSTYLAEQDRTAVVMTLPPTPDHRATNTPLPPGSLPTATRPAPAAQPVSEDGEGIDPAVAGGIAAAVVAALGLALLAWGRRRRR